MTDYTPTTQEVRNAWWRDQCPANDLDFDDVYNAAFDRWLAAHDAEVRAETLRGAADSVHNEARWQQEQVMRGAVQKSGAETAVDRLLVIEDLLRQQALHWEQEGADQ